MRNHLVWDQEIVKMLQKTDFQKRRPKTHFSSPSRGYESDKKGLLTRRGKRWAIKSWWGIKMCSTKQTSCKNIAVETQLEYCCWWCSHTSWWSSWWESFLEVFLEIISWFKEVTILSWNEGIMTYSHEFQHLPMILYKIGILHNNF